MNKSDWIECPKTNIPQICLQPPPRFTCNVTPKNYRDVWSLNNFCSSSIWIFFVGVFFRILFCLLFPHDLEGSNYIFQTPKKNAGKIHRTHQGLHLLSLQSCHQLLRTWHNYPWVSKHLGVGGMTGPRKTYL